MLHWSEALRRALPLPDVRQPLRQLSAHSVHGDQDPLLRQRRHAAVSAESLRRNQLSSVRHRNRTRPYHGAYAERCFASLPAGYSLRLPYPTDGHHSAAHCPVRPAHQPLQREDLHLHLVLVRVHRPVDDRQLRAMAVDDRLPLQSDTLHPEAPQDHGQTEPRQRPRPQTVAQVRRDVLATGRRFRPQAGRQEFDGPGRRRHCRRALGQLQEQADERRTFRRRRRRRRWRRLTVPVDQPRRR